MAILAFDCSSAQASVALAHQGRVECIPLGALRDQGSRLIPCIQELLQQQKCERSDIKHILTMRGPGSFTGVRVALATALGLQTALGVPVYGYTALQVMACKIRQQKADFPFVVGMKSAQNDFFYQQFHSYDEISEAVQGHPEANLPFYEENISTQDLIGAFLQGPEAWKQEALENAFEPFYIRAPDVTMPKATPWPAKLS